MLTYPCNKSTCLMYFPKVWLADWLDGWVFWHINFCRLFNVKSIFK